MALCLSGGCAAPPGPAPAEICQPGALRCDRNRLLACTGFTEELLQDCSLSSELCDANLGCTAPTRDACEVASAARSYIGCDYYLASLSNPLLATLRGEAFDFAVVIANPGDVDADVQVARAGELVATAHVAAGKASTVPLPWVSELVAERAQSVLVDDGAYRITSTQPIAANQYNPLAFRLDESCRIDDIDEADLECFSFTNDASLLLPTTALGTTYMIDTMGGQDGYLGGFVAVIATATGDVRIRPRSALEASSDGRITSMAANEWHTLHMEAGAVAQFVSLGGELTATEVEAAAPVLVFAGHACADVPLGSGACDHLEEVMPPTDAWGTHVVAAAPQSVANEPYVLRILSAHDDNNAQISGLQSTVTLNRGEHFDLIVLNDCEISASAPILVTQYLVGAAFFDRRPSRSRGPRLGDPAMGIAIPTAQFRADYVFVAPESYDANHIAVVAHLDDTVELDRVWITGWQQVAESDFAVVRMPIAAGTHRLSATNGASVTMYAVAPFTSYLLPAGLNVEQLQ